MYAKFTDPKLKQHHHIWVDQELRLDCQAWIEFLYNMEALAKLSIDFSVDTLCADEIQFFTDAAKSDRLGLGCVFGPHWVSKLWNGFVKRCNLSIEYLELFALTVGINLWGHYFANKRVIVFCDNMSVVHMVNSSSAKCKNCMVLIRLIVINSLHYNFRVFVKHVSGINNTRADLLSRNKISTFKSISKGQSDEFPTLVLSKLWPSEKIWHKH